MNTKVTYGCLAAAILILAGVSVWQDRQISQLRAEQKKDRELHDYASKTFLDAALIYRKEQIENEGFQVLVLKHNDLLITNVQNGRLERPNAGKIIPAIVANPYESDKEKPKKDP